MEYLLSLSYPCLILIIILIGISLTSTCYLISIIAKTCDDDTIEPVYKFKYLVILLLAFPINLILLLIILIDKFFYFIARD